MNKFLATIALSALALTSCIKNDDTYQELLPVQPGITIYQHTWNQQTLSMQAANAGLRLGVLLAEAHKQYPEQNLADVDLLELKVDKRIVKNELFNQRTTVVRQENGNYLITFDENSQIPGGFALKGAVLVETNGAELLSETSPGTPWTVEMRELKLIAYDSQYSKTQTFSLNGGTTRLFSNADGSYQIMIEAINANLEIESTEEAPIYSSWSGDFTLTPKDASLAYSLCANETFDFEGSAQGPTIYSTDVASSVGMKYEVIEGLYKGLALVSGTEKCSFTSAFEYNTVQFPSPEVRYVWSWNGSSSRTFKIYYNNYVYPKD